MKFLLCILLLVLLQIISAEEKLHSSDSGLEETEEFQEPGLWRPRWIIDREFFDKSTGKVTGRDRLFVKFLNNRTIKLYHSSRRPFWNVLKGSKPKRDEIVEDFDPEQDEDPAASLGLVSVDENDGSYRFRNQEKVFGRLTADILELKTGERIRYDTLCTFGKLDPYAMNFEDGEIFRKKKTNSRSGIAVSAWSPAGRFAIRANVNRPLVSKDFLAFQ